MGQEKKKQLPDLEVSSLLVISDEVVFIEDGGSRVDEVRSESLQVSVAFHQFVFDAVQSRSFQHPQVQIGVACTVRNINSITDTLH